jgi:NAD+ kinase
MLHRNLSAKSPCFVHSHLDKGASLQDWLEVHAHHNEVLGSDVGVVKALQQYHQPPYHSSCLALMEEAMHIKYGAGVWHVPKKVIQNCLA